MIPVLKKLLFNVLGIYDFDRQAEHRIRKMYALYASGSKINQLRALQLCNRIRHKYQIYVYPTTKVGKNLYIAHCQGITIGKTAVIGDNCRIFPHVTIASKSVRGGGDQRHAHIGNNCVLCANSTILGNITIGDNVIIGANALVTKDIPSNSVVIGKNQVRAITEEELKQITIKNK